MSAEKDKFSYLGAVTILLPTDHDVVSHFESEKSELRARVPSIWSWGGGMINSPKLYVGLPSWHSGLGVYFRSTRKKGQASFPATISENSSTEGSWNVSEPAAASLPTWRPGLVCAGVASKDWREDDRYEPRLHKELHNYFTGIHVKTLNFMRGWAWNLPTIKTLWGRCPLCLNGDWQCAPSLI